MIRVFIVDDHPVVVEGIHSLLANEKELTWVGHALSAAACSEFFNTHDTDVLLMDISLPDKSGVDLCVEIKNKKPLVSILALTTLNQASYIQKMMENGASGYVLKNCDKEELIEAIHAVASGKTFLSHDAFEIITHATTKKEAVPRITRREKEILDLVVEGLTSGEIATKLFVSQWTVDSHRKSLMTKFNTKNTASLIKYAFENGLIEFNR
jgi:DNA-binding NarL/FixJ family response regulator